MDRSDWLRKYHRVTNYISASMLYLKDNFLLEESLKPEHIKDRILGHWGTVPGLNFVYGGLDVLIKEKIQPKKKLKLSLEQNDLTPTLSSSGEGVAAVNSVMLIAGPGHGAPAIISGLYVEGTLQEYYPKATLDSKGLGYVLKQFSWPKGFPSHTWPGLPGQIHEGGELGYSLGTAFGTVFDNPGLMTVCVVGDGEAETGPLSASWQSNKFLNHKTDGVVLPILHLNGYRISGPTIFSKMSDNEIRSYFVGLGYKVYFVDQYELEDAIYEEFLDTLDDVYEDIGDYKKNGGRLPMIVLRTMKGWTGAKYLPTEDGAYVKVEDNNLSHGIPIQNPKKNEEEMKILEEWLRSYNIQELLVDDHNLNNKIIFKIEINKFIPEENYRIGKNKFASGDPARLELNLPQLEDHELKVGQRGARTESRMVEIAQYIRDIFSLNEDSKNFRLFSPDESESNMLEDIFTVTSRAFNRKMREWDEAYSADGRIMEILSEHVLQEWMQGYILSGRYGILISYEAFLNIITSQIEQYLKFLKQTLEFEWRKPLSSMNYIATSTTWRQDHNGFTHQNPGLINTLISKQTNHSQVFFPADANIFLATLENCLKETNTLNLIISDKRESPQWLSLDEARDHVKKGISVWEWASSLVRPSGGLSLRKGKSDPDVVIASAGDHQTLETLAATQILKEDIPYLTFQYVNINKLSNLGFGNLEAAMTKDDFDKYFTKDKGIVFNFHGYPEAIKQLMFGQGVENRISILGYREQGSTTTPFDMQVLNGTSRYHVCIEAIKHASKVNSKVKSNAHAYITKYEKILKDHEHHIVEYGDDMPRIKNFKFSYSLLTSNF